MTTITPGLKVTLTAAAKEVAETRADWAVLDEKEEAQRDAWVEQNSELLSYLAKAKARKVEAEDALREVALEVHEQTGSKDIASGVRIRVQRQANYLEETAIEWAVNAGQFKFLRLNKRAFSKHALAVAKTLPFPFVAIDDVPTATIAKDMSIWLEREE